MLNRFGWKIQRILLANNSIVTGGNQTSADDK